jgi:hypothetical protein
MPQQTITHTVTLPADKFEQLEQGERFLFTKCLPIYSEGDPFNVILEGHRTQLQFTIARIDTAKVFKNYCILVLAAFKLEAVDDLPTSVGGGSKQDREPGDGHDELS